MKKKCMMLILAAVLGLMDVTAGAYTGADTAITVQAAAPSATTVAGAVKKAYGDNYLPNYRLGKNEIKEKYGVSSTWYTSAYAEVPMISAQVDQLVVIKTKNSRTAKKTIRALKNYQRDLKEDTMQYPMNRLKIQGSRVFAKGRYVCFFMLGQISSQTEQSGSESAIIKAYQRQNEKAAAAVKKALA